MPTRAARSPGLVRHYFAVPLTCLGVIGQLLHRCLPKGLFPRSLLIIVVPVIVLQGVVAYIFMERHWELVTNRLSETLVGEISALMEISEALPEERRDVALRSIGRAMNLSASLHSGETLPPPTAKPFFALLDRTLSRGINNQIGRPFWIDTVGRSSFVEIRIKLDDAVLRVIARRNRAYASNSHIFIVWMVATSLVLLTVAVLFLRNQIRPIQRLADAADRFGKGQPATEIRPRGAQEVRVATAAFLEMRHRIERQIEQRTTMLAGVSHDLRTILTHFRLELELLDQSDEAEALRADVDDMEAMLSAYLEFAEGAGDEDAKTVDLKTVLEHLARATRAEPPVEVECPPGLTVRVRENAIRRCIGNLLSNALRYGTLARLSVTKSRNWYIIHVDDDGPGIQPEDREAVFKPFLRLDEARNVDSGGTGLGLAIALDIARGHGGEIGLGVSPLGGLRASLRLPM